MISSFDPGWVTNASGQSIGLCAFALNAQPLRYCRGMVSASTDG